MDDGAGPVDTAPSVSTLLASSPSLAALGVGKPAAQAAAKVAALVDAVRASYNSMMESSAGRVGALLAARQGQTGVLGRLGRLRAAPAPADRAADGGDQRALEV